MPSALIMPEDVELSISKSGDVVTVHHHHTAHVEPDVNPYAANNHHHHHLNGTHNNTAAVANNHIESGKLLPTTTETTVEKLSTIETSPTLLDDDDDLEEDVEKPSPENHSERPPLERQLSVTERPVPHSNIGLAMEYFKYFYSTLLLIVCVVIVHAAMFTYQTNGTANFRIPPVVTMFVFWFLIFWLGMMEGGQGALVGLQPIAKSLYAETHPKSLKNTSLVHKGDNMERFIVGRQFLVVLVITLVNMFGTAIPGASVFQFPSILNDIFLANGFAMIFTTIVIGHLTAQLNSADCMLDFINNYFMLFTSYVSLGIEFSGLLHCVYLVQMIFAKMTGQPIESNEPPRTIVQKFFFWTRVIMSLTVLGTCLAVTLTALFDGKTGMWEGVPPYVSVIILFVLMSIVGMMEGMQIALFAVINLPEEELSERKVAHANCKLAFAGHNLQCFLIGRQILVATLVFVVARITSPKYGPDDPNIWGVSDGLQEFFNTGLTGAVITTVIGSLAWRIIASSFPLGFLSNPVIYVIIRVCLALEYSGLCSGAWVLGRINKFIGRFQKDEVYLEKSGDTNC